jgi:hypothetical protein
MRTGERGQGIAGPEDADEGRSMMPLCPITPSSYEVMKPGRW